MLIFMFFTDNKDLVLSEAEPNWWKASKAYYIREDEVFKNSLRIWMEN